MNLSAGTRIGSYEVLHLLGKGGMGEVYRARDTRLGRDAALKLLPENLGSDADYLARFRREAMTLASLSHPNVAQIYGLEEVGENRCIVMELVEGATLDERIRQGPIPVDDALEIARQIALGIEAAHEKGIVHRDLKPANIKVTPDGKVKVLDFGLAKGLDPQFTSALSSAPTGNLTGTHLGVIMGTVAYMSPEQAKGKSADARSDIWAFGVVLYEMLTGRAAFEGETTIDVLGGVTRAEPDWSALPKTTPPAVRSVLRRCLRKDFRQRLHHIADARIEIEEGLREPVDTAQHVPSPHRERVFWGIAVILAALAGFSVSRFRPAGNPKSADVVRLPIALPAGQQMTNDWPVIALSPDGSTLAYASGGQLYVRAMNSVEARVVNGARPATAPFFSPDGEWIGFFGAGKLQKIPVSGGAPEVITDAPVTRGADWGPDDNIYFASSASAGLRKASAQGGASEELTAPDRSAGEISHRFPQALPGGKAVLFTVWTGPGLDERRVELLVLSTKERRVVVKNGHTGRYVSSGHIAYTRAGVLMAVPFDLDRLQVTGPPFSLDLQIREGGEAAHFGVSASGSLAYSPGSVKQFERRLGWIDRKGNIEILPAPTRDYVDIALAPDGRTAAVDTQGPTRAIWIYDFTRNTLNPLTTPGSSQFPEWTPNSAFVIYRGTRSGFRNLYRKAADGSGEEVQLTDKANTPIVTSVSRDGKWLLYHDGDPAVGTGTDIMVLSLEGKASPEVFLRTPFSEEWPRFSPDGKWISYTSNESGRNEIYVRPFPGPGQKVPISTEGGGASEWSTDSRELFYSIGARRMVVQVATQPVFSAGPSRQLYDVRVSASAVSADGQRTLVILPTDAEQPLTQIHVVTHWAEELKKRSAGSR